jgi:CRISPR-associated protein (TIGR02584 family)
MLKEVFIFVAGATPQIITETIYALSQKDPPVYPHEIYIITTSTGKKIIKDTLVKKGILNELFTEYNIPPVTLKDDSSQITQGLKFKLLLNSEQLSKTLEKSAPFAV